MKPRNTSFMVEDILGLKKTKNENSATRNQKDEIRPTYVERNIDLTSIKSNLSKAKASSKRRRNKSSSVKLRQCFSSQEVNQLERLFEETIGYPDTSTRKRLAVEMQVSEAKIQIWFQNRRAKFRRQKRQQARQLNIFRTQYDFQSHANIATSFLPKSLNFMNYLSLMSQQIKWPNLHQNIEMKRTSPSMTKFED